MMARQPAASSSSGKTCSGSSKSSIQPAFDSSLMMPTAPSWAMSRIITQRPAIKAIRAASFMLGDSDTSLEQEVAHGDDNRKNWRAYTGCYENGDQPTEPGERREQEQHIIGMKALDALEVECFHTRWTKSLQQFGAPHDE